MEQGGTFEESTVVPGHPVQGLQAVKEHEREPGHGPVVCKPVRIGRCESFTRHTDLRFPEFPCRDEPLPPRVRESLPEIVPYLYPGEGLPVAYKMAVHQDPFPFAVVQENTHACKRCGVRAILFFL